MPYSLENPPSAPKKKKQETDLLKLWQHEPRCLLPEFEAEEARSLQLRKVEAAIRKRRREELEERFLWLRADFKVKPLDGPYPQPNGEVLFL